MYSLTLMANICLYGFVIIRWLENLISTLNICKASNLSHNLNRQSLFHYLIRTIINFIVIALIIFIANIYPNINSLFNYIGLFSGVLLTYVFPCLIFEKIHFEKSFSAQRVVNFTIIGVTSVLGITGIVL